MRPLLPVSLGLVLIVGGCSDRPAAEPPGAAIPPRGAADYSVFTGGLHITNFSEDKPVIWVFSPYAPLRERVKAISGFDTKSGIEGSQTMCLLVIKHRDGGFSEHAVSVSPLHRYIGKTRFPVSELVADLNKSLQ